MVIQQLNMTDRQVAEAVLHVQRPAYQVEAAIIGFDEIPPLKDTVETLQTSFETFYGYDVDQLLVGVIGVQQVDHVLDIHRLVVHPSYFRRGIGRELLSFVLDAFHDKVASFLVHTGTRNYPAKNLYQSLGFKETEQILVSPALSLSMLVKKVSEV
jgi:ribosomal protein S18 acetylase RimI-like enzyme